MIIICNLQFIISGHFLKIVVPGLIRSSNFTILLRGTIATQPVDLLKDKFCKKLTQSESRKDIFVKEFFDHTLCLAWQLTMKEVNKDVMQPLSINKDLARAILLQLLLLRNF